MDAPQNNPPRSGLRGVLNPSRQHTAGTATLLLAAGSATSSIMSLVRTKYIASVFGAGPQADAFYAAFQLPDMLLYLLVGGAVSITLVSMLSRFHKDGDEEGESHALSVVLNAMAAVMLVGVILAEIFAPQYVHWMFGKFDPARADLCIRLTRIILPGQFFFFVGQVLGARLLIRRMFLIQAVSFPLYTGTVVVAGVLFAKQLGIYALAWGVVAGMFLGPFLLNLYGAYTSGLRYRFFVQLRHPLFLEWLRLSLPLMIGVSLVTADKWILAHFAAADQGGITRLNNAKQFFNPMLAIIGQAAGAASLPFFVAVFNKGEISAFSTAVNRSVTRVSAMSILCTSWLVAISMPLLTLVMRGGAFHQLDTVETASYFTVFTLSLVFWSAQGIYARAFYAASDTMTPAVAGTSVTLVSFPVYSLLFHLYGTTGLTWASNIGIFVQLAVLVVLLHKKRLVSLAELDWLELARAVGASICGWLAAEAILHIGALDPPGRAWIAIRILCVTLAWAAVAYGALTAFGSPLPAQVLRRRKV